MPLNPMHPANTPIITLIITSQGSSSKNVNYVPKSDIDTGTFVILMIGMAIFFWLIVFYGDEDTKRKLNQKH